MPELVYNVRFEVDSSNIQKIGNIVDPNSSAQVQDLNKEIEELRNKLKNIKGGSGSKNPVEGASQGFLDFLQNVRTSTAELIKNTSTFKKSIVSTDANTDSLINQSEALLDGAINLQQLRTELEGLAEQESLTDKQTEYLFKSISQLANAQRTAVSASKNFEDGLQVLEHQSGTMNKAFSGSNQLLFSFGDLVQDSAQFSQGFAQGMRAIGNNVGFTAELFANLQNNVKRHNDLVAKGILKNEKQVTTQEALINSLKGTGGVLIGINAAVLASQFLFQKLDDQIKKVRDSAIAQAEAIKEVAKSFSELETGVEDPFGFRARAIEIGVLQEQIGDFNREDELKEYFDRTGAGGFMFKERILEIGAAFNENDAAFLKYLERMEALSNELETAKMTQEAFNKVISDSTAPLSKYIEFTAALELVNLEAKSGLELTDRTLQNLSESTKEQINVLKEQITAKKSSGESTVAEISTLVRLISFQEKVNKLIDEETKLRKERDENRAKAISDLSRVNYLNERNAEFINKEIQILKERDEISKVSMQADLDRAKATVQFKIEQAQLEEKLLEQGVSRDAIDRALLVDRKEFEARLALITAEELVNIAEIRRDREIEIEKEKLDLLKRLRDQEEKDRKASYQESLDFIKGTIDDELMLNQLKRQNELAGEDEKTRVLGEIDDKYDAKKRALRKGGIWNSQIIQQLEIAMEREKAEAIARINEESAEERKQNVQSLLRIAGNYTDGFASLKKQELKSELQAAKARGASAKEIERIQKKQFEVDKKAQLAKAIINTASAVTEALPNVKKSVAIGLLGALQIAKILKTKFGGGDSGGVGISASRVSSDTEERSAASGIISFGKNIATPSNRNVGFIPSRGGEFSATEITVVNTFDDETVADVVDRGNRKRQMQQVVVS